MLIGDYFRDGGRLRFGPWVTALLAAAAGYAYWAAWDGTQGHLGGGDTLPLWCGLWGAVCMVGAFAILPAHRCWMNRPARRSDDRLPRRPRFTRAAYLRAHVYLGMLSVVLVICHAGPTRAWGRLGPRLDSGLLVAFLLTNATGLLGIGFQHVLPRVLTRTIPEETHGRLGEIPIAQVKAACDRLQERADELVSTVAAARGPGTHKAYEKQIRPVLKQLRLWGLVSPTRWSRAERAVLTLSAAPGAEQTVSELAALVRDRKRLRDQELIYALMHAWLIAHVAFAVLSLVLLVPHIVWSLYY
jgi:hypothetical protein